MTNSFYLHYEDMRKMALVCCGSSPGPLLMEGNSLHTPPRSHILGVGVETEYVMQKKKKKPNETDTDKSASCGLVAP